MLHVKPSIGRIVHLIGPHAESNGAKVASAIITRAWSDTLVNVTVFPDCGVVHNATSIKFVESEDEARTAVEAADYPLSVAYWPPRV